MENQEVKDRHSALNRYLRFIHGITGVIGSVIVLIMAVTGILLNHRSWVGYSSDTSMKMQKFLFQIHTGTVGNLSLKWLTDFGAVCMIVLSITGIMIWCKSSFKKFFRRGI